MNRLVTIILSQFVLLISCQAQQKPLIGGPFENSEFMYIGMSDDIDSRDTTQGWFSTGQKLMITGTVLKQDGITPVPDVIIYYYHTDTKGYYANQKGLDKRVARHGYLRGWVKSDEHGKYAIHTVRPAAYPNRDDPAHIHPAILEPGFDNPYYIDAFVFDDDPLLTTAKRRSMENRGGTGILRPLAQGDVQVAEHNIILGLNIPNYPTDTNNSIKSGLEIGEDNPSFTPFHAFGPDKGTKTCPVCKYGRYHGIVYFVGNNPNWTEIKKWLTFLEQESIEREKYLKAYFVYGNETDYDKTQRMQQLEKLGNKLDLRKIALTFVPSFSDKTSSTFPLKPFSKLGRLNLKSTSLS